MRRGCKSEQNLQIPLRGRLQKLMRSLPDTAKLEEAFKGLQREDTLSPGGHITSLL